MAALNFPANPSLNDEYSANGATWRWNGTAWVRLGDPGAQGAQGAPGVQGAQGADGAQGAQGSQGFQGRQGTVGAQGAQGAQGADGVQGAVGAQGAQGAQGFQGRQGTVGAQGAQGAQGFQGIQGTAGGDGVQGAVGAQGAQGAQGADGNFGGATFDYTFSTTTTDSDPGQGIVRFNNATLSSATQMFIDDTDDNGTDIQSFLRTIDDSTSSIKGHFRVSNRLNADDFAIFTIDGSITETTGYFKVPCTRISGATSFSDTEDVIVTFARTGDKGDVGAQGAQGAQGFQGRQGTVGTVGAQGAQGADGVQGAVGAQGAQGAQGFQGRQGTVGTVGAQGAQGAQGSQGFQGRQGTVGAQGAQGADGVQGAQGAQGAQGFQGRQGTVGAQGAQGAQGFQGRQGTVGAQGAQGSPGVQGADGGAGAQGAQGAQGFQGRQGAIGAQGAQGTPGAQGAQGATGPVGGSNTQVLFNSSGSAAGDAGLTFSASANKLTLGNQHRLGLGDFTTTQRNALTGVSVGEVIYNSTTNTVQIYAVAASGSNAWMNIDATLGTQNNPALTAQDILTVNPSAPDGVYWFKNPSGSNTVYKTYCIMQKYNGGWMKIAQYNGGTSLNTSSAVNLNGSWVNSEVNTNQAGKLSSSDMATWMGNATLWRVTGGSDNLFNNGSGTAKLEYESPYSLPTFPTYVDPNTYAYTLSLDTTSNGSWDYAVRYTPDGRTPCNHTTNVWINDHNYNSSLLTSAPPYTGYAQCWTFGPTAMYSNLHWMSGLSSQSNGSTAWGNNSTTAFAIFVKSSSSFTSPEINF